MTPERRNQVWAGTATTLLIAALGWGINTFHVGQQLKTQNEQLTLRADSLLALRGKLEKDIVLLSSDLQKTTAQSGQLKASLEQVNQTLEQKERLLRKLKQETRNVKTLEQQVNELSVLRKNMAAQLDALNRENTKLLAENTELKSQIDHLTAENTDLTDKLRRKEEAAAYRPLLSAESFRAEVLRKNDKLTVRSRKARQLDISFDLPNGLGIQGVQTVFLSLRDPNSKAISGKDSRSVMVQLTNGHRFQISSQLNKDINFSQSPQRVEFRYKLEDRLKAGHYFAEFYTDNAYLGSVQFRVI
jgi:myosin heavy subunit